MRVNIQELFLQEMINRVIIGGRVVSIKKRKDTFFVLLCNSYKFMDKYTKEVKVRDCNHWIKFNNLNAKKIKIKDFIVVEGKLTYVHNKNNKEDKIGLILALGFTFVKNIPIPKITYEDYQEVL